MEPQDGQSERGIDSLLRRRPEIRSPLDPDFRPAALGHRAFAAEAASANGPDIRLALEQPDGSVFRFKKRILPAHHPAAGANFFFLERLIKFLLWSRGGYRIYFDGPAELGCAPSVAFPGNRRRANSTPTSWAKEFTGQPFEVVVDQGHSAAARQQPATGPASRRLPHRVRSGGQRPESGGGDRRAGLSSARRRCGTRCRNPIRNGISIRSWIRSKRRPSTCRGSMPLAGVRPGFMSIIAFGWRRFFAACRRLCLTGACAIFLWN